MITTNLRLILLATALAAIPALAQHTGHSPHAGQQHRPIKALSDKEVKDLLDGAGMGFAKAAELNRHPGPMHALEHGAALELSETQLEALTALMTRHKAEARALGARVVELERAVARLPPQDAPRDDGAADIVASGSIRGGARICGRQGSPPSPLAVQEAQLPQAFCSWIGGHGTSP